MTALHSVGAAAQQYIAQLILGSNELRGWLIHPWLAMARQLILITISQLMGFPVGLQSVRSVSLVLALNCVKRTERTGCSHSDHNLGLWKSSSRSLPCHKSLVQYNFISPLYVTSETQC
jgi:hypothetical protein